jgi:RNA polymerase sigma-70 factor (ECF subfamily)
MEESDEDLVASCQQGSLHAFETLVRQYQPRILRFLEKHLGNRQDAEDVTQRTFLQAHRCLGRFRSGSRFAPWLFTIARRQGIDFLRHAGSRRKLQEQLLAEPPPEAGADPSTLLGQREGVDELWRQIWSRLDSRSCEILWLRIQEEMELPEIAKVMKLSRTHVKVLLHRARKSLLKTFPSHSSESPANSAGARPEPASHPLSR